jgi:hypothetical protein
MIVGSLDLFAAETYISVWINLMFPEIRLNREFLRSNFPTLAAYA